MGSEAVGLVAAFLAILLFGSFALPTKTAQTGDGLFFQWVMCCGIFVVGIITHLVQRLTQRNAILSTSIATCPVFEHMAAVGGAIWCLSNLLLVPLVDTLGIGLTMVLWGLWECLAGWLTGRFGLLGLNREPVANALLNYAGAGLILASLVLIALIQPTVSSNEPAAPAKLHPTLPESGAEAQAWLHPPEAATVDDAAVLRHRLLPGSEAGESVNASGVIGRPAAVEQVASASEAPAVAGPKWTDRLSPLQKRVFGSAACMLAGCLSGSTFTPVQYVVDKTADAATAAGNATTVAAGPFPGASTALLDHLFAHNTGIWLASTAFFAVYLAVAREPDIHAPSIPAFLAAGIVWGCAMICWFLANANLSIVVAYPLVTLGPGICSVLWGLCLYREITGARNLLLLAASTAAYCAGAACIVLSDPQQ